MSQIKFYHYRSGEVIERIFAVDVQHKELKISLVKFGTKDVNFSAARKLNFDLYVEQCEEITFAQFVKYLKIAQKSELRVLKILSNN